MSGRASRWVLIAAVLGGCSPASEAPSPTGTPMGASSAPTRWVTAIAPTATALLEAPARVLTPHHGRAMITVPSRARIVAVHVQPGAHVAVADPVLDVILPDAAAAAAAYLAAVDESAAYEQRRDQLATLRAEGLARSADVATVALELARLHGVRDLAATSLRSAGLELRTARALASSGGRTTLRAPIAGIVMAVVVSPGEMRTGDDVLVEIVAGGGTRIEARMTRAIPAGARLEYVAPDATPIAATLATTAPSRDPDGSIRAWFELATPAPSGELGRLRVVLPAGAATEVPASAIAHDDRGAYVWQRVHDIATRVPIHVLVTTGGAALVEGLKTGDEVAAVASAIAAASAEATP